jgi:hypothetical protein
MKLERALLIGIWSLRLCFATSLPPFAGECALLDRVSEAARPQSPTAGAVLKILELVALGRMDSADAQLETRIGLKAGQLRGSDFRSETVREHALRKIADIDLPQALDFLQGLKKEDLEPDGSARIWPTVSITLHQARLNRIPEPMAKIAFLEDTLSEWNAAVSWAAEELCDRGSYASLPLIRKSIHQRLSTARDAEDQIGFCEARVSLLSRNPDRITALGSFLSVNEGSTDRRLIVWAVNQLYSMKSDRADGELKRYLAELDGALPSTVDAARKAVFAQTRQEISELLERRGK